MPTFFHLKQTPMHTNIITRFNGEVRSFMASKYRLQELQDMDFLMSPTTHPLFQEFQSQPNLSLAPGEDGLVVIDFDSKWIGDFQNYTYLGRFHEAVLYRSMEEARRQSKKPLFLGLLQKAMDCGAISAIQWIEVPLEKEGKMQWEKTALKDSELTTFPDLFKFLKKQWSQEIKGKPLRKEIHSLIFSPPNWTLEHFETATPEAYFKIIQTLFDKGFEVTSFTHGWQEFAQKIIEKTEEGEVFEEYQALTHLQAFMVGLDRLRLNQALPVMSNTTSKKKL